jgi:Transposase Tn5 dimerisation domain/Transposase DNA-binding
MATHRSEEQEDAGDWARHEMETANFGDERLRRRAEIVLGSLARRPEGSVPAACQGWAETQAAYRLFSNENVTGERVLEPHRDATLERMKEFPVVLCIQDTTELDYTSKPGIQGLGPLTYSASNGLHLHPTLAVTPERLCLGVLDQWSWARDAEDHGGKDRHHRLNRPIEEKESLRWLEGYRCVCDLQSVLPQTRLVYMADRESDLFELFEAGVSGEAAWLIRASYDRKLSDGRRLWQAVQETEVLGILEFDLTAAEGRPARHVVQTLRAARLELRPPPRVGRKLSALEVTAILAWEESPPPGVEPVQWLLLTSLPVMSGPEAEEKVRWYLCRWQIEVYFRILKSGCKVEQLQLQTRERLEVALAFYMVIAWRVLYLSMLGRTVPDLPCEVVFSVEEWKAIYIVVQKKKPPLCPPPLREMLALMARLGGYLARKGDGPPGPKAIWIGLQRTRDFVVAIEAMGNLA